MAHVGTLADDEGPPHIRKLPNKCHICETNKHDSVCTGCLGDVSAPGGPHAPTKVCAVSCGDHAQRAFGDAAHELKDHPCSRCGGWCCCSWDEEWWNSPKQLADRGGYVDPVQCLSVINCKFEDCDWRLRVAKGSGRYAGTKEVRREAFVAHLTEKHRSALAPATAATSDDEMEEDPIANWGGASSLAVRGATMGGFEGEWAGRFSNMAGTTGAGSGVFPETNTGGSYLHELSTDLVYLPPDDREMAEMMLDDLDFSQYGTSSGAPVGGASDDGVGSLSHMHAQGAPLDDLAGVFENGAGADTGLLHSGQQPQQQQQQKLQVTLRQPMPTITVFMVLTGPSGTYTADLRTHLAKFYRHLGIEIDTFEHNSQVQFSCTLFACQDNIEMLISKCELTTDFFYDLTSAELTTLGGVIHIIDKGSLIIEGCITWEGLKSMLAKRERHRSSSSASVLDGEDVATPLSNDAGLKDDGASAFYKHLDEVHIKMVKPTERVTTFAAKMTVEQYTEMAGSAIA